MTDLEKAHRAKMCIDKLADGIDPISDTEMPEDGTLNNVKLSRCFFFVSDILRQVIENGGAVKPANKSKLAGFQLSPEAISAFPYSRQPIRISQLVDTLNGLIDTGRTKKITTTVITGWLLEKGFMALKEYPDGKRARHPTKQGEYIGLSTEARIGQHGDFFVVLYNEDAQHFVIDNLDAMLESYRRKNT